MATPPRYRPITFGNSSLQVTQNAQGHTYVQTTEAPKEYPLRLTDRLIHWAKTAPDRTFMARRDDHGNWRKVSYAQALEAARHIGQALLDRKLSVDRPVLILSDNDLEHGLLHWVVNMQVFRTHHFHRLIRCYPRTSPSCSTPSIS